MKRFHAVSAELVLSYFEVLCLRFKLIECLMRLVKHSPQLKHTTLSDFVILLQLFLALSLANHHFCP